ncbi:hypothetical protein STHERM_c03300 [Spirochaeta thermophila DSM 6192]|uniref:PEGA domain-containing protein n=2 Tax=Winmispira thermophila TaxID=154 RepID=E0RPA9_WINT6|nr:hypothetical protein STHERM_c03300 [Spirochaeta thermophila DSM 6192]
MRFVRPLFLMLLCISSLSAITLSLKVFPQDALLLEDGRPLTPTGRKETVAYYWLPAGDHLLELWAPGYHSKFLHLSLTKSVFIEEKLERKDSRLRLVGEFPTGRQPKGIVFSPDGRFFYVTLLDDEGVEIFSADPLAYVGRASPPPYFAGQRGFVEGYILHGILWISQMTANRVHAFSLDGTYLFTSDRVGIWPKVIAGTHRGDLLFVSNWESNDIAFLDPVSGRVVGRVPVSATPRGLAVTPDDRFLYVCNYDTGVLEKIDIPHQQVVKVIDWEFGAKRHAVVDRQGRFLYLSDMYLGTITKFDLGSEAPVKERYIGPKLNTIALSPDGRYLFVSSRGHNNPETYLKKGPDHGKVFVLDTRTLEVVDWVWGRNQPTGLAVSPDGRYLVFSDFLDHNIEVYDVSRLRAE